MAPEQPNPISDASPGLDHDLLRHSHDSFLAALTSMAGIPALIAQLEHAREMAARALAKFDDEMLPHHAVEEQVLFPAMIRSARTEPEREQVRLLTQQLTAEHRNVEQLWASVAPGLRALAQGPPAELNAALFARLVRDYSRHVMCEDSQLLPLARMLLRRAPARNALKEHAKQFTGPGASSVVGR